MRPLAFCSTVRPGRLATKQIDITPAKADVVQFAVRQFAKNVAGDPRIIPPGQNAESVGQARDGAVGGDGTERRRACRFDGGHGGYPFLKLIKMEARSSMQRQMVLLHVQSKLGDGMPELRPMHGSLRILVMFFNLFQPNGTKCRLFLTHGRFLHLRSERPDCWHACESHWRMFPFRASRDPRARKESRDARHRH